MYKKFILACLALAAFVAFAALATTASASPVLCETTVGGPCDNLANGATLKYTNVGESLMTNSSGSVLTRCTTAVLHGTVKKNNGTEVESEVTEATFTGSGSESRCTATFGDSIVTPTVTAEASAHGLPWCMVATNKMESDEFQLKGGACGVARDLRFILDVLGGTECEYQRLTATEPLRGTFTTDTGIEEAAQVTLTKQKFNRIRGSSLVCPSEGFLDMTFKLETKDGTKVFTK